MMSNGKRNPDYEARYHCTRSLPVNGGGVRHRARDSLVDVEVNSSPFDSGALHILHVNKHIIAHMAIQSRKSVNHISGSGSTRN